ncbi:MAG: nuclear transport factor 2 family protein [Chitinophagaceae bacterium]|nr:MAG: nuclear transport factor 2 family protein [Chitinophagaceae bacterium]
MDLNKFIADWIAVGNKYDTDKWLSFFHPDALLDDPSVGRKFTGHAGIRDYFERYFIGFKTKTKLVKVTPALQGAFVEVAFTGDFPGCKLAGSFDIILTGEKISFVEADLK